MKTSITAFLLSLTVGCSGCGDGLINHKFAIVGDSISIMHTRYTVAQAAAQGWTGKHASPPGQSGLDFPDSDNCMNSTYTLQNLDRWIQDFGAVGTYVWNNGIWDCTDMPTSPQLYAQNIQSIAAKLKGTGARVIFFTTTEIQSAPGCAEERNAIARQVLPALGVEIFDLYAVTHGHADWHGRGTTPNPSDVHYLDSINQQIIAPFAVKAIIK